MIDVAFIPVRALLNAAYPGFFRSGKEGIRGTLRYSRSLLIRIVPYSLFAFAALMIGASIVPRILGVQYAHVTEALRWLSLLPILKTLHYFAADALTGAGYQEFVLLSPELQFSTFCSTSGSFQHTDGVAQRGQVLPATACWRRSSG